MFDLRTLITVPFVVVGGVATRLYSPERMTDDLDILVHADHSAQIAREAPECDLLPDGVRLDVTLSREKWAEEALAKPAFGPNDLPIIALPFLVLMKMQASRGIDIGDLTRMLGAADDASLTQARWVIQSYLQDGVKDLDGLIQLGRLEYQQGQRD